MLERGFEGKTQRSTALQRQLNPTRIETNSQRTRRGSSIISKMGGLLVASTSLLLVQKAQAAHHEGGKSSCSALLCPAQLCSSRLGTHLTERAELRIPAYLMSVKIGLFSDNSKSILFITRPWPFCQCFCWSRFHGEQWSIQWLYRWNCPRRPRSQKMDRSQSRLIHVLVSTLHFL